MALHRLALTVAPSNDLDEDGAERLRLLDDHFPLDDQLEQGQKGHPPLAPGGIPTEVFLKSRPPADCPQEIGHVIFDAGKSNPQDDRLTTSPPTGQFGHRLSEPDQDLRRVGPGGRSIPESRRTDGTTQAPLDLPSVLKPSGGLSKGLIIQQTPHQGAAGVFVGGVGLGPVGRVRGQDHPTLEPEKVGRHGQKLDGDLEAILP
jgi:hypothetical protein